MRRTSAHRRRPARGRRRFRRRFEAAGRPHHRPRACTWSRSPSPEKGYRHNPVTGELRPDDPYVLADLQVPHSPDGAWCVGARDCPTGRGRSRPADRDLSATTCPTMAGCWNGSFTTSPRWQVFPSKAPLSRRRWSDRIVPVTTEYDIAELYERIGVRDEAPVICEPFRQWVIENRFAGPVPAWSSVGAQLVDDAAPWEQLKLRMLNAAHSTLAYLGLRLGYRSIADAVGDPVLLDVCRRLFAEDVVPLTRGAARRRRDRVRRIRVRPLRQSRAATHHHPGRGRRLAEDRTAATAHGVRPGRTGRNRTMGGAGRCRMGVARCRPGRRLRPARSSWPTRAPTNSVTSPRAFPLRRRCDGWSATRPSPVTPAGNTEFIDRVVTVADDLHRHGSAALLAEVGR